MTSPTPVIEVVDLAKTYRIYGNPYHRLLERLPWVERRLYREVPALHDVTFTVARGESMGLVGSNGAGKSTLLKVLSGTTFPTAGRYTVHGRVTSLLELGAGFHLGFSGRENVFMNAALLGWSRREANRKFGEIVEFSELGDFIDAPVRTYSTGMAARLGFSIAIASDPELLIIDEVFAVGDLHFRRKCVERIFAFKRSGRSLLFCSHSLYDVRQICERAIWLRQGRVQLIADAVTTTNEYATWEEKRSTEAADPVAFRAASAVPATDDGPRIVSAVLVDPATGQRRNHYAPGDTAAVRVHVRNPQRERLIVAVGAMRGDGTLCFAHSMQFADLSFTFAEGYVTFRIERLRLLSGEFSVPVWLLDERGVHRFQERPAEQNLVVAHRTKDVGVYLQESHWSFEPLVE